MMVGMTSLSADTELGKVVEEADEEERDTTDIVSSLGWGSISVTPCVVGASPPRSTSGEHSTSRFPSLSSKRL